MLQGYKGPQRPTAKTYPSKKGWHVVKDSAAIQLEEGSIPRKECEISTEPLGHYQG